MHDNNNKRSFSDRTDALQPALSSSNDHKGTQQRHFKHSGLIRLVCSAGEAVSLHATSKRLCCVAARSIKTAIQQFFDVFLFHVQLVVS